MASTTASKNKQGNAAAAGGAQLPLSFQLELSKIQRAALEGQLVVTQTPFGLPWDVSEHYILQYCDFTTLESLAGTYGPFYTLLRDTPFGDLEVEGMAATPAAASTEEEDSGATLAQKMAAERQAKNLDRIRAAMGENRPSERVYKRLFDNGHFFTCELFKKARKKSLAITKASYREKLMYLHGTHPKHLDRAAFDNHVAKFEKKQADNGNPVGQIAKQVEARKKLIKVLQREASKFPHSVLTCQHNGAWMKYHGGPAHWYGGRDVSLGCEDCGCAIRVPGHIYIY